MKFSLDEKLRLGYVHLRVQSMEKQQAFYEKLGLRVLSKKEDEVRFSVNGTDPILILSTEKNVVLKPPRTTGLYHFALLVPSRSDLAYVIGNLLEQKVQMDGASDHLFSEAFYLKDAEGNGIEIYHDRPREEWPIEPNGQYAAASDPIDFKGIMSLYNPSIPWTGFPKNTVLGHMHLHVSNISDVQDFYMQDIGLEVMTNYMNSALFMATGGYHHHIAVNVWQGIGAPKPPANATGLVGYSLLLSSIEELQKVKVNLQSRNVSFLENEGKLMVTDSNNHELIFSLQNQ